MCLRGSVAAEWVRLAEIDVVVSARLGSSRVIGNSQPPPFNRHVAIYLAKHVSNALFSDSSYDLLDSIFHHHQAVYTPQPDSRQDQPMVRAYRFHRFSNSGV